MATSTSDQWTPHGVEQPRLGPTLASSDTPTPSNSRVDVREPEDARAVIEHGQRDPPGVERARPLGGDSRSPTSRG